MNYKLSPSDFAFLYEGCKRCYYLKVVHSIPQPSVPLPSIFSKMAVLLKNHYSGKHTKELHPALPPGIVKFGEQNVKSKTIEFPGHGFTLFISGRFDIVIQFENGGYGVIDFKTGNPNGEYNNLYSRQLHGYAYALENPDPRGLSLAPITKLGLLYFYPSKVNQQTIEELSYQAEIHWVEIKKDMQGFAKFLEEVMSVLESPKLPDPSPDCRWCNYRSKLRKLNGTFNF